MGTKRDMISAELTDVTSLKEIVHEDRRKSKEENSKNHFTHRMPCKYYLYDNTDFSLRNTMLHFYHDNDPKKYYPRKRHLHR